ncbi:MAG TPA: DEAD/DEAH box helicase family protein [Planctomycetota bacterium]|nr:DEAD/DEAH box helicase family protein [Planctomycetota bacterium]
MGFFSSTAFRQLGAAAFGTFIERGGTFRLLTCPVLSSRDVSEVLEHLDHPRSYSEPPPGPSWFSQPHEVFRWLLTRSDRFQLRFGFSEAPLVQPGIYHEKLGIFLDPFGDIVAFVGSLNETETGFRRNFEHVEVFCSWRQSDQSRVMEKLSHFEALWNNRVPGVRVLEAHAARGLLISRRESDPEQEQTGAHKNEPIIPIDTATETAASEPDEGRMAKPHVPETIKLRPHQLAAVAAWLERGLRGILKMATGTGKTFAALSSATLVTNRATEGFLVAVVCPYTHLVDQWAGHAESFHFQPVKCYGSVRSWSKTLTRDLALTERSTGRTSMLITTQATFRGPEFQQLIRSFKKRALLIADEVHGMGSQALLATLNDSHPFQFRLGLSATPDRFFDDAGTQGIEDYFGPIVYTFGLKEALDAGILVPYDYFPQPIELIPDERDTYLDLTRAISRALGKVAADPDGQTGLEALLTRRSRLLASATQKLPALKRLLLAETQDRGRVSHTLVYCGDGTVETDDDHDVQEVRYVEATADLLTFDLRIPCGLYLAETRLDYRRQLQRQLEDGSIGAVVAIRCLDEGIDMPPVHTAHILASTRNPRQFIQRRGRILRQHPESGKRHARIYDYVVVPPHPPDEASWRTERRLFRNELRRVLEFSRLSRNEGVTLRTFRTLREQYQLLSLDTESSYDDIDLL